MLALGTGLIVLITVAGVGLGFAGGWFCFKYARRKNIFNDTDREYFQNLLFRAETAEEKLTKPEKVPPPQGEPLAPVDPVLPFAPVAPFAPPAPVAPFKIPAKMKAATIIM